MVPAPALGAPPHAVSAVDALRDWIDALAAQRRSAEFSARALDAQISGLLVALRTAEEAVRLKTDQIAQRRSAAPPERLQAELDVARLQGRVAALELTRADNARAQARERAEALSAQIEPALRELVRAQPVQFIDDAAIENVEAASRQARTRINADRRVLGKWLLAADGAGSKVAAESPAAREAAALRGALAALDELDAIEAGRMEVWRQRRLALAAVRDAGLQGEAAAVLGRSIEQLTARSQATADRLAQLRSLLSAERLRAEALPPGAPALAAERRALEARQREIDGLEAVHEGLLRLQRLLERSQDDLGAQIAGAPAPWSERWRATLQAAAQAVWRYELFSVSESTTVAGRTVTQDYGVTVGKSIGVVLLFFAGWWAASRISGALIGVAVRRMKLSPQLGRVIQRWAMTLLLLGVLIVVLKLARIPLTVFAFLGGALAIGIGFGTQTIIKNLISGVIILFERKVRVGDVVTIDGVTGTVHSVDLRATTVRGFDGIEAIVPNSQLLENRVSNWSYGGAVVRRTVTVGLRYGDDARAASDQMLACATAHPAVLDQPAPDVLFEEFGSDAQRLRLQYWMQLGGPRAGPELDSDLRHAISQAFTRHGLRVAFPQRELHLRLQERPGVTAEGP
jgi:small-conductance mechanosensitive channel